MDVVAVKDCGHKSRTLTFVIIQVIVQPALVYIVQSVDITRFSLIYFISDSKERHCLSL